MRLRLPSWGRGTVAGAVEAVGAATARFRLLPSFLIVGGQRCGTNSLYESLADHPSVGRAMPGQEVHFFDLAFDRGLEWYRGHFPTQWWHRSALARTGAGITGESSPYYTFHPLALERIAATLPGVKLIMLLRDPVERAYSHYHHERRRGHEDLSFEEALEAEPERLAGEAERIRANPTYSSFGHQHYSYAARGHYADQIEAMRKLFPPEEIKIVISERLFTEPDAVYADTLDFLGIPSVSRTVMRRYNAGSYPKMPASVRARLNAQFQASNARVAEMLGVDPPWGE